MATAAQSRQVSCKERHCLLIRLCLSSVLENPLLFETSRYGGFRSETTVPADGMKFQQNQQKHVGDRPPLVESVQVQVKAPSSGRRVPVESELFQQHILQLRDIPALLAQTSRRSCIPFPRKKTLTNLNDNLEK